MTIPDSPCTAPDGVGLAARSFSSVLVANRGEIARRVIATAHRRGLATVAVYSDPDTGSAHVAEADAAVRLPGATPTETYLNARALIDAALTAGAEAIHPGYGFLSENAEFARAVRDAGMVWIGPNPEAIEAMGSKVAAKERMSAAGVPMLSDLDPATVTAAQFPVLVKASAGGGGRGMRIVREPGALAAEVEAARREALSAFGDGTVFCERYLESSRHVEVQILADVHGTVWAVGERECSIQRRYQKIVEEAPSPFVERTPGMREQLFATARSAAEAIGYTGAGTVEFLTTDGGEFFFLETNTRLQVEHPVTEATTGLDLVGLQFDVAAGLPLPATKPPPTRGWAIEVRLYAEDPAADWRPSAGTLWEFEVPGVVTEFSGPPAAAFAPAAGAVAVRMDSGVDTSRGPAQVGTDYDPMLAKIIAAADTRPAAAGALARALVGARIHGLRTNRDLLVRILKDPGFLAGDTTSAFLTGDRLSELAAPLLGARERAVAVAAAALASELGAHQAGLLARFPVGFRSTGPGRVFRTLLDGDGAWEVALRSGRGGLVVESVAIDGQYVLDAETAPHVHSVGATEVVLVDGGVRRRILVTRRPVSADPDSGAVIDADTPAGSVHLIEPPRFPEAGSATMRGSLLAPMPGAVIRVEAGVGDRVVAGQTLLWVDAMKMQHAVVADVSGTLTELRVAAGDRVDAGDVLAVVSPDEQESDVLPPSKPHSPNEEGQR